MSKLILLLLSVAFLLLVLLQLMESPQAHILLELLRRLLGGMEHMPYAS